MIATARTYPIANDSPLRTMPDMKTSVLASLLVTLHAPACAPAPSHLGPSPGNAHEAARVDPYCGCLALVDDARSESDLELVAEFQPQSLTRAWYRWGEPPPEKAYQRRTWFVQQLQNRHVTFGGGGSLSVVQPSELSSPDFQTAWLSVDLDGVRYTKDGLFFGSLAVPGFRSYLVKQAVLQASLGARELHFGETNGEIHFDDWALGIRGDSGFVQWILARHPRDSEGWWRSYLGELGVAIANHRVVTRSLFQDLSGQQRANFQREWGKEGSWKGAPTGGEATFLASLYARDLDLFLGELRVKLEERGLAATSIDVWGLADWMKGLAHKPDAYLTMPPESAYGFHWGTDAETPLAAIKPAMTSIMSEQATEFAPVPIVYMIDHPSPFLEFRKLPDGRQAEVTEFLARLAWSLGANFVFRSYSEDRSALGPLTKAKIQAMCVEAHARCREGARS